MEYGPELPAIVIAFVNRPDAVTTISEKSPASKWHTTDPDTVKLLNTDAMLVGFTDTGVKIPESVCIYTIRLVEVDKVA